MEHKGWANMHFLRAEDKDRGDWDVTRKVITCEKQREKGNSIHLSRSEVYFSEKCRFRKKIEIPNRKVLSGPRSGVS